MAKENGLAKCKHCGAVITWSDMFGWYHGVITSGWNTTCLDGEGEFRAEPEDAAGWLASRSRAISFEEFMAHQESQVAYEKRRTEFFESLMEPKVDDIDHRFNDPLDPNHKHRFIPVKDQPKGRKNFMCSCELKMEGPDGV